MATPNGDDADRTSEQTPLLDRPATKSSIRSLSIFQRGKTSSVLCSQASQQPARPSSSNGSAGPGAGAGAGSGTDAEPPASGQQSPPSPQRTVADPDWDEPAGLHPRRPDDEMLLLFRHAVGINSAAAADTEACSVERRRKTATGIYARVLQGKRIKTLQYNVLSVFVNTGHVVQILAGAALTALGSAPATHARALTALGATNTVLAGVFALLRGQGLPDRLHKDAVEFRRVQDWIEETDTLLASGVLGRSRKDVGLLVETAFKMYNAVVASEENNKPGNYVRQPPEGDRGDESAGTPARVVRSSAVGPSDFDRTGNAIVRLDVSDVCPASGGGRMSEAD